jgi:pilus assembly protein Flp/PilA
MTARMSRVARRWLQPGALWRGRRRERAQGMVEYALTLMLMALVVIVLLSIVGAQTNNVFSNINNGLSV